MITLAGRVTAVYRSLDQIEITYAEDDAFVVDNCGGCFKHGDLVQVEIILRDPERGEEERR